MKAHEVMTANPLTIRAETTVEQIARMLTGARINSAPVVDDEGRVIGIVSEHDLFMKEKGIPFSAVRLPERFEAWVGPDQLARIYDGARHHTAADIMTSDVFCVDVDEHIGMVAWFMMQWGVERVPVVERERLVGIISRSDLIRLLANPERDPLSAEPAPA